MMYAFQVHKRLGSHVPVLVSELHQRSRDVVGAAASVLERGPVGSLKRGQRIRK